jgi:hypothetical protein
MTYEGASSASHINIQFKSQTAWRIHVCDLAARGARSFENRSPLKIEGAGKTGCTLHPRSRVHKKRTSAHTSIQVQRKHSGLPRAMALRLISCSPRRRILVVTVADGLKDCLNPVGSTRLRQLDTSNGCQDHTVLPYASASFRLRALDRSQTEVRPAITSTRPTLSRPPLPVPRSRRWPTPLLSGQDGASCGLDLPDGQRGIFS